jgi:hypothetical protein
VIALEVDICRPEDGLDVRVFYRGQLRLGQLKAIRRAVDASLKDEIRKAFEADERRLAGLRQEWGE